MVASVDPRKNFRVLPPAQLVQAFVVFKLAPSDVEFAIKAVVGRASQIYSPVLAGPLSVFLLIDLDKVVFVELLGLHFIKLI